MGANESMSTGKSFTGGNHAYVGDISSDNRYRLSNCFLGNATFIGASRLDGQRTVNETCPIKSTFTYWVKAYPTKFDVGSINLAHLINDIQAAVISVNDLESRTQVKFDTKAGVYAGGYANEVNLLLVPQ